MATKQNYFVVHKGTKQFLLYLEQWLMAEKCVSSASKCKLDGVVLWKASGVHAILVVCGDGLWFAFGAVVGLLVKK